MPGITAGVAMIIAVALSIASTDVRVRIVWLAAALVAAIAWRVAPAVLLFVPPAALNIAFGMLFAATLAPGREPLIATFARLERGELRPEIAHYARSLTWIWTVLFFVSAAIGLGLAAYAPLDVWSAFVNIGSYVAVAVLFVGEYVYRRVRFPNDRHASLASIVRLVMRYRQSQR